MFFAFDLRTKFDRKVAKIFTSCKQIVKVSCNYSCHCKTRYFTRRKSVLNLWNFSYQKPRKKREISFVTLQKIYIIWLRDSHLFLFMFLITDISNQSGLSNVFDKQVSRVFYSSAWPIRSRSPLLNMRNIWAKLSLPFE